MIEVIYLLLALNVLQLLFWSFQVQKLVDKLMCKHLPEYKSAQRPTKTPELKIEEPEEVVKLGDFRI
jgi:hypothetical protein